MKFALVLVAAVASAAPLFTTSEETALAKRQFDFITNLLCAHDHLHTSKDCDARKAASGENDVTILLDPFGTGLSAKASSSSSGGLGGLGALLGY